jgi:predicted nucleotide-binding protein with TIR-like domain
MDKPSVFIGSSSDGLEIARAVQTQLEDVGEVELWNEGVFGLSHGTLESLVQALDTFDFAVLVMTPDDLTVSGGMPQNSARDNVLIEIGLFIGRLGRGRTFMLYPKGSNVRIPSDLAGVTLALFSKPSDDTKLLSAVGPACFKIRNAIRGEGKTIQLGRVTQRQDILESRIRTLQIVTKGIVTDFEFEKLKGLAGEPPFLVRFHWDMYHELKRLDAIRYVHPQPGYGLVSIQGFDGSGKDFDLKQYAKITDQGREYLKLREELFQALG